MCCNGIANRRGDSSTAPVITAAEERGYRCDICPHVGGGRCHHSNKSGRTCKQCDEASSSNLQTTYRQPTMCDFQRPVWTAWPSTACTYRTSSESPGSLLCDPHSVLRQLDSVNVVPEVNSALFRLRLPQKVDQ